MTRASQLGRVLHSYDHDMLVEASLRQYNGIQFSGVIYCHEIDAVVGKAIDDLELLCKVLDPADVQDLVYYLPL